MNITQGLDDLRQIPPGAVVSIGNFDGVHRGHAALLAHARNLQSKAKSAELAVVTFEPHPLTVLRPDHVPPRLATVNHKHELLAAAGVDRLIELAPSRDVLNLTAEQFWQILRDQVRPSHLVEGPSFTFGRGRGGTIEKLREWSAVSEVKLHVIDPVTIPLLNLNVVPVSSSVIRWLLDGGRVRDAAICLGRAYSLEGTVIAGAARGRDLGFPTANLQIESQLIPEDGVYAGRCAIAGRQWPAAVSIGTNPTFGANPRTVEAHLIEFSGDLYGQFLRLELLDWQREQRAFARIEALKDWIARDVQETLRRVDRDPSLPIASA